MIAFTMFDEFTALDAVGPYSVLKSGFLPDAEVVLCAANSGEVADDAGLLRLQVDATLDEVDSPDIVVVPGGTITRKMSTEGHPIVEWLKRVSPGTTYTTSVCTGSLLLGAAGLLSGLPATTHWRAYEELAAFGAEVTEQRVVQAGKIITAAGVSSGIDMALTLVGITHGDEMAEALQLGIEYDPQPPYDSGSPSKADPAIVQMVSEFMSVPSET